MTNKATFFSAIRFRVNICLLTMFAGLSLIMLTGCATPEVRDLQKTITQLEDQVDHLEKRVDYEAAEKDYHRQRESTLEREKNARMREAAKTLRDVRVFAETVVRAAERAAGDVRALDYHGYEIINRDKMLSETKNVLLVDMENTVPADGHFIGARAYIRGTPARLRFCLLRAMDTNKFEVVAVSEVVSADKNGAAQWSFSRPIIVREGYHIGVFAYNGMPIPYDDVGTGNVAYITQSSEIEMGDQIRINVPVGRRTRAFSFGMVGYYE